LRVITERNDLHNNLLACELGIEQHTNSPESNWVQEQNKLREQLLEQLSGDPQSMHDQFREMERLSAGLLFAVNPTSGTLDNSKVGFEMEGRDVRGVPLRGVPGMFSKGEDGRNTEIREAHGGSPLNTHFQQQIVELWRWVADSFNVLRTGSSFNNNSNTLHFHLDQTAHPNPPDMGGLYTDIRENDHGTHEQLGIAPPVSPNTTTAILQAGVMDSSRGRSEESTTGVLNTEGNPPESWHHLVWGHFCSVVQDPTERLCFLIALKDPFALAAFDPKPLHESYGDALLGFELSRVLVTDTQKVDVLSMYFESGSVRRQRVQVRVSLIWMCYLKIASGLVV
jgi:hypothetical protein